MKRADRLLRLPALQNQCRISRDPLPLFICPCQQGAGVRRYAGVNNLRFVMHILYHTYRAKVAEKGKENGDDTHT